MKTALTAIMITILLYLLNRGEFFHSPWIWAQEAEKRVSEIDKGKAKIVPGEKVFARIRTKYER